MNIDFVLPWVDGSDINWRAEKDKYQNDNQMADADSDSRYRDWGFLPYWFRAVEKYAPWVRMIHFVTWGHIPTFLNIDCPKIHIVRHDDYIPEEWLPTFSSHTIELNLHRISGLADHFVYFNDDMFLNKPMKEEDFFYNGLPCAQFTEIPLGFVGKMQVWQYAAANDLSIVNKWFPKGNPGKIMLGKRVSYKYAWYDNVRTMAMNLLFPNYYTGFKNFHCPIAYQKKTFEELWEKEPELLSNTSAHRFRNPNDVNQWLMLWWQLAGGDFYPRAMNTCNYGINKENIDLICKDIISHEHEMICLNDPEDINSEEEIELFKKKSMVAFEKTFSKKSVYEI